MSTTLQQQLAAVCGVLATHTAPQTPDDALRLTGEALRRALGQVRLLFYLDSPLPPLERLTLTPCPGYYLVPDVFVYQATTKTDSFVFESRQPYAAPLTLASIYTFGFLLVDQAAAVPLTEVEEGMIILLATQTAHHLDHLRRQTTAPARNNHPKTHLVIDEANSQVWIDGMSLPLSNRELNALHLLYRHRSDTCSRDLLDAVIYPDEASLPHSRHSRLDTLIHRLRKKLHGVAGDKITIETVRGIGYSLRL